MLALVSVSSVFLIFLAYFGFLLFLEGLSLFRSRGVVRAQVLLSMTLVNIYNAPV